MPTLALPAPRSIAVAVVSTAAALALAGCVANDPAAQDTGAVTVDSSAQACTLSSTEAPSGTLSFSITNSGDEVTEFYLLADDGLRVLGEVENVGPGLTRDLVVQLAPGEYTTQCKPGMVGEGIRATFTVTDSGTAVGPTGDTADQLEAAEASYLAYVKDQVGTLISGTQEFADAYAAGDDDTARDLYAAVRVHWERIEPVAESFGDLDPLLDLREADLEEGQAWTGWHLVEKDLWPPAPEADGGATYVPLTAAERVTAADFLVDTTQTLVEAVNDPAFTVEAFAISNGAKELLDEVATGKVTGEEEIWSHTDLWDMQANVDGARVAFETLRTVTAEEDPALVESLDTAFDALQTLLSAQGSVETGFTTYDELSADEVRALAAAVDAVSEPLSRLTAVVTSAS
ncbi:MAG: peptidase M75 family protein [Cellulomonadaceae bacterium]|nr:peptidase M75 family protein [Cellulomonadaceae bacterium]